MANHPAREEIEATSAAVRERFEAQKRVLSFGEFVQLYFEHPARHGRDAARYLRDCFDHYGSTTLTKPFGEVTRYHLFDLPFESRDQTRHRDYLVGQEALQEAFYRTLSNFAREGRINRLFLMHGPNGSAKSTFASCVMRAMEHYSTLDDGALYRFSWIFPRGRDGKTLGFGSTDDAIDVGETYAHLEEGKIDVKLASELREHPLLLLPIAERRELIRKAHAARGVTEAAPDWIWSGALSHKNKQVYEALLTAYRGDLGKVLSHVQVERYYISRRYRVGAVTIGPQMAVDASERQITADRSLAALPASLSSLALFESYGELVDAAGGLVEYSDLLKRPLDAWKYLLLAIETGEAALQVSILPLNSVLLASSNELHLNAFREHSEFNSFRGRLVLIRAPYLLDYREEQTIYDSQVVPQVRRHVTPHATFVASLWAVLTRLRRPQGDKYRSRELGKIASDLTPLEKAELYTDGAIPERLGTEEATELKAGIATIYREPDSWPVYEGLTGASPREIRLLLLDAAQHPDYACLSPLVVLDRIDDLCARNDYDFLRETPQRGYHDHRAFVSQVKHRWLERVDDEFRRATGIVEETQYLELFERYVTHVSYWIKNERVYNRVTGKHEEPDLELMKSIEKTLEVEDADNFRRDLISGVAAWAIDHAGEKAEYSRLFPRHIQRVRDSYYKERRVRLATIASDVLATLAEETGSIDADRRAVASDTFAALERVGYCKHCARDAIAELIKARYTE